MYKWIDKNGRVTYSNMAPPSSAKDVTTSKEASDNSVKQPTSLSKEQIENARRNLSNPRIVPISISGTIVDTQGKPLSGVKMTIKESRMIPGTFEEKHTRRYETINGAFDVHCKDCSDVRLRFSAKGYYPEDISFQSNEMEKKGFMFERKGDGFKLTRHGVVVQLKKSCDTVTLNRTTANLDFRQDGVSRVLFFDGGKLRLTSRQWVMKERSSGGKKELGMISLNAPMSVLNEIVITLYNYPSAFRAQKSIYVEFSGTDTGVIAANVSPVGNWRDIYKKMLIAPEHGYSNKLFITLKNKQKQYFYCRIGGLYGKGNVSSLSANSPSSNNKTLTVSIEIYLNAAGSRNLNAINY